MKIKALQLHLHVVQQLNDYLNFWNNYTNHFFMSFDECVTFPNGQQVGDLNETGDTKSTLLK